MTKCPMEGFDRAQYDEILGLKAKGYSSAVIATLGYRLPTDKYASAPKVRFGDAAKPAVRISMAKD